MRRKLYSIRQVWGILVLRQYSWSGWLRRGYNGCHIEVLPVRRHETVQYWPERCGLDVGAAAVAEGRFADGIAAFRLGLAVEQGDAELSEKLRDGLAWAKLRLAAERRKQNAEGTD